MQLQEMSFPFAVPPHEHMDLQGSSPGPTRSNAMGQEGVADVAGCVIAPAPSWRILRELEQLLSRTNRLDETTSGRSLALSIL